MIRGQLERVEDRPRGSQLIVGEVDPYPVGTTLLALQDVETFDDAGGELRIESSDHTYSAGAVDPDAGTITLDQPLTQDTDAGELVAVRNGDQILTDRVAWVRVIDADDPYKVVIPHGIWERFPTGTEAYETPWPVLVSEDLQTLVDVDGRPPQLDLRFAQPGSLPEDLIGPPIDPPAGTPDMDVDALTNAFMVTLGPTAAGTTMRLEVATDEAFTQIVRVEETANSPTLLGPIASGIPHWIRRTAFNVQGEAESIVSGPYLTRLVTDDDIATMAVDKLISGKLAAAIALIGQMRVGPHIEMSGDGGFVCQLPNNRRIVLGAPGEEALVEALLHTWGLISEGNASLNGANNWIRGTVTVAGGVTAPTAALRVGPTWPTSKRIALENATTSHRGLWWTGSQWASALNAPYFLYISRWSSSGAVAAATQLSDIFPYGYATASGVNYVIGQIADGTWWLHAYNSAWARTAAVALPTMDAEPALTITSAGVEVFYCRDGNLRRRWHNPSTLAVVDNQVVDATWGAFNVRGVVMGNLDYGSSHVLAVRGTVVRCYTAVSSTTYTRQTTREFSRPNSEDLAGLAWDGTQLVALTVAGNLWAYAPVPTTVSSRTGAHTKYDGDTVGGTHETTPSPSMTFAHPARTWMLLQADPVGDSGQPNDPDRPRFYVDGHLQPDVASGATTTLLGAPAVSGIAAPTSNGFAAIGGLNGAVKSEATMTSGKPVWAWNGDGPANLGVYAIDQTGARIDDPWHNVGTFGSTFESGVSAGSEAPAFYIDHTGRVHLVGLVSLTAAPPSGGKTLFTLPSGYRPTRNKRWTQSNGGAGLINIVAYTGGTVAAFPAGGTVPTVFNVAGDFATR